MPNGEGFLLGALGAAAMELIKLYERYETMKLGRFKRASYWVRGSLHGPCTHKLRNWSSGKLS